MEKHLNLKKKDEEQDKENPALTTQVGPNTKEEEEEQERVAAWVRMDKLITELYEMIKSKRNLHADVKTKAASVRSAGRRRRRGWCGASERPRA